MRKSAASVGLGALLMYFFDPQNGRRRRNVARDRTFRIIRRLSRRTARAGRGIGAATYGMRQKAVHRREQPKPQPDDVTLARKVETEIFRDPDVPKGQINVNAVDGVVYLRGEVQADMIDHLVDKARKVQGVRDVQSLLHTPA
jgi:osmotically-inducible protein OsmY